MVTGLPVSVPLAAETWNDPDLVLAVKVPAVATPLELVVTMHWVAGVLFVLPEQPEAVKVPEAPDAGISTGSDPGSATNSDRKPKP